LSVTELQLVTVPNVYNGHTETEPYAKRDTVTTPHDGYQSTHPEQQRKVNDVIQN